MSRFSGNRSNLLTEPHPSDFQIAIGDDIFREMNVERNVSYSLKKEM
jgi:hypothetical protein